MPKNSPTVGSRRNFGTHSDTRKSSPIQYERVVFIYRIRKLHPNFHPETGRAAVYCRVSSAKQKKDLETQINHVQTAAENKGYRPIVYRDIGSGLNDNRQNLQRLIRDAYGGKFDAVFVHYADRLARFGIRPIRLIFEMLQIPLFILHTPPEVNLEAQLVEDMVGLLTSFAGKLHRMRRGKGKTIHQPA